MRISSVMIAALSVCPMVLQAQAVKPLEKAVGGISLRNLQQQIAVQGGVQNYLRGTHQIMIARPASLPHETKAARSVSGVVDHYRVAQNGGVAFTLPQAPKEVLKAVEIQYPLYAMAEGFYLAPHSFVVEMPDGDLRLFTNEDPIPPSVHAAIIQARQLPAQELGKAVGGLSAQELRQKTVQAVWSEQMPRNTVAFRSIENIAKRYARSPKNVNFVLPESEAALKAIEVPFPTYAIEEAVFLPEGSYVVEMPNGDYRVFTDSTPMSAAAKQAIQMAQQVASEKLAQWEAERAAAQKKLETAGFSQEEVQTMMKSWEAAHPVR